MKISNNRIPQAFLQPICLECVMRQVYLLIGLLLLFSPIAIYAQQLSKQNGIEAYNDLHTWKYAEIATSPSDSGLSVLGRWAWGPCQAVDVEGNYAYIGNGPTFHVLDISNPALPKIIGEYLTEGHVNDIQLQGSLAFVCIGRGLLILDVSDPHQPKKAGEISINGVAIRVSPEGSTAYVTNFAGGLIVVDVSDVTLPKLRGNIPVGGQLPWCLAAKDGYVYIGNPEFPDLALVDATNPDTLKRSFVSLGGWGHSAVVKDTLLYVGMMEYSGNRVLKIFSVANPAVPVELGKTKLDDSVYTNINSVTVANSYAYIATQDSGIYSIDVSDPLMPEVRSNIRHNGFPLSGGSAISSVNGNVFAAYRSGLWIVNASQPDSLQKQGFFPTGEHASKIDLRDNLAFIASGRAGLWILDVANPQKPESISNINTGSFTSDVVVSDDFVYIVNWPFSQNESTRGLWIIDISDPFHPQIVSHYSGIVRFLQSRAPNAITKSGDLIFITQMPTPGNDSTLEIIDISDPVQPRHISTFLSKNLPLDIAVQDSFAYLATFDEGLKIIDWHDPYSPIEIYRNFKSALGIGLSNEFAYVDRADTFFVVNVSNPHSPIVVGKFGRNYGSFSSIDLVVSNDYVYWADGILGAIDVSDPANPQERALFEGRHRARGVAVRGSTIFFADQTMGIWILKNNLISSIKVEDNTPSVPPNRFELFQNFPNPFNPQTTIEFLVPNKAMVIIDVFNVSGQKVTTLHKGIVAAGRHRIEFDASEFPSGVYLYSLTSKDISITKKMVVIE